MDNGLPLGGRSCAGIFNYLLDVAEWIFKKVYEAPHLCYLLVDTNSHKLKADQNILGWAWSEMGVASLVT